MPSIAIKNPPISLSDGVSGTNGTIVDSRTTTTSPLPSPSSVSSKSSQKPSSVDTTKPSPTDNADTASSVNNVVANGKNCSSNSSSSTKLDTNPLPSVNEMIFEDNPGVHRKPLFAYKSNEEYLYAMKEDLAEWLNNLYNLSINEENFIQKLETGAVLCR